ncbi:MAG: hypothetical protein AB9869_25970 [Verrucomicrobiia bacterium]
MTPDRIQLQQVETELTTKQRELEMLRAVKSHLQKIVDNGIESVRTQLGVHIGRLNIDSACERMSRAAGAKVLLTDGDCLPKWEAEAVARVTNAEKQVDAARARFAAELEVSHEESAALQAALATTPEQEKAEAAKRHQDKQARIAKRASELAAK